MVVELGGTPSSELIAAERAIIDADIASYDTWSRASRLVDAAVLAECFGNEGMIDDEEEAYT